ncbi:RNA polymerase sigma factor [Seonamhaeicola marinus]|uniref:RNA polymerase sigma factor n=1 Tax=Seonamhaeicola marinus TaxID=1912246 RepID=A0A5D0HK46_9FLAO|nr:RNA polymerase sigma factor [Seonamhaeicola marinus]TYA71668.1 RNA polymerase sigma factor [Seonamhaeicola marinus]
MSGDDYSIDAKLVIDYQSGNKMAMAQLVKRWHKTFCNKAYWIVKDKHVAKDIAQDSWKTIIEKVNDLNNPKTFASWSLRIVCNKSFDWIKKNKRTKERLETIQVNNETEELLEKDEREQLLSHLLEAINALPNHQQMVVKLFYTEAYSLKDISRTLHISEGTAKSRLYHAREKLKTILKNRTHEK